MKGDRDERKAVVDESVCNRDFRVDGGYRGTIIYGRGVGRNYGS